MTRYKDSVFSAKQEDFNRIKFGNIQVTKINDCIVGQSIFKKLGKKKCTNKKNNWSKCKWYIENIVQKLSLKCLSFYMHVSFDDKARTGRIFQFRWRKYQNVHEFDLIPRLWTLKWLTSVKLKSLKFGKLIEVLVYTGEANKSKYPSSSNTYKFGIE